MRWFRLVPALMAMVMLSSCTSAEPPTPNNSPIVKTKTEPKEVLPSFYSAPATLSVDKLSKREKVWLEELEKVKGNPEVLYGGGLGPTGASYGISKEMGVLLSRTDYGLSVAIANAVGTGAVYDAETDTKAITRAYAVTANTQKRLDILVPALKAWKQQYSYYPQTYWDSRTNEWVMSGAPVGKPGSRVVLDLPKTFDPRGYIMPKGTGYFNYFNEKTGEKVRLRVRKGKITGAVSVVDIPVVDN